MRTCIAMLAGALIGVMLLPESERTGQSGCLVSLFGVMFYGAFVGAGLSLVFGLIRWSRKLA